MEHTDIIRESVILPLLSSGGFSQSKSFCPVCRDDRRNKVDKSLSVKIENDAAVYHCHHCGIRGRVPLGNKEVNVTESRNPVSESELNDLSDSQVEWFLENRSISRDTLTRCGVVSSERYIGSNESVSVVGFPYANGHGLEAVKWRDKAKRFSQSGAARTLWRINEFTGGDLVVAEGEIDAMSFEEVGVAATSVPNGAPSSQSSNYGRKFSYLWHSRDKIAAADRIILATDSDDPGNFLAEEIARRVGKARCWRVKYPSDCKDANDVLTRHGKEALVRCLDDATPWPISGLRTAKEFGESVTRIYEDGVAKTYGSGVEELDSIFRVGPQTLTIVTGVPGSGKSTLITWLMAMLSSKYGFRFAVFSAEMPTQIHILQLCSVYMQKPYEGPGRMSREELDRAIEWVDRNFVFIDDDESNIDSVLDRAYAAVLRLGVRGLVIDPYNFLTTDSSDDNSSGSISKMLVRLKRFSSDHDLSTFLVAHPAKMYKEGGKYPTPGGYSISGSAAFFNVADSGITVGRGESKGVSVVTCWKSRFPWLGETGSALLRFDQSKSSFGGMGFGQKKEEKPWTDMDFGDF
jgi:twinkle protein